jgi:Skp family chaperone for outer membrane proteins
MLRLVLTALALFVFTSAQADDKIRVAVVDFDRLVDSVCSKDDGGLAFAKRLRGNAELKFDEATQAVAKAKIKLNNKVDSNAVELAQLMLGQAQNDMARADSVFATAKVHFAKRARNRIRGIANKLGYEFVVSRIGMVSLPSNAVEVNITQQVVKACE